MGCQSRHSKQPAWRLESLHGDALAVLADVQLRRGRIGEAEAARVKACADPATDWRRSYCQSLQGAIHAARKSFPLAEALLASGYRGMVQERRKCRLPEPCAYSMQKTGSTRSTRQWAGRCPAQLGNRDQAAATIASRGPNVLLIRSKAALQALLMGSISLTYSPSSDNRMASS